MADLPNLQIPRPSQFSNLQSIEVIDLVGPAAANRQPDTLRSQTETLRDFVDKLVQNMNELTGQDENGNNVTSDGNPQYLERGGSHPLLGNIDAGSHRITNAQDAQNSQDYVTLSQLNASAQNLNPLLPRDGSRPMTGSLDFGSNKGINLLDPTSAQDSATKKYVDDQFNFATGSGNASDFESRLLYPARVGSDIVHGLSDADFAFVTVENSADIGRVTLPIMQASDRNDPPGYVLLNDTLIHLRSRGNDNWLQFQASFDDSGDDPLDGDLNGLSSGKATVRIFSPRTQNVNRYDSGWFNVVSDNVYNKIHGLGQFPDIVIVELADNTSVGSQTWRVPSLGTCTDDRSGNKRQSHVVDIDDEGYSLVTTSNLAEIDVIRSDNDVGNNRKPSSGAARVLMYGGWTPDFDTGWIGENGVVDPNEQVNVGNVTFPTARLIDPDKQAFFIQHNRGKIPSLVMAYVRMQRNVPSTIVFDTSTQPSDGETVTLGDETDQVTFEFDDDNSVSSGNTPVTIGASADNTMDNLEGKINNANAISLSANKVSSSPPEAEVSGFGRKVRHNATDITTFSNVITCVALGSRIHNEEGSAVLDIDEDFLTLISGAKAPYEIVDTDGEEVNNDDVRSLTDSSGRTYHPFQYRIKLWD